MIGGLVSAKLMRSSGPRCSSGAGRMEENKAIMEMYRKTAELKVGRADLKGGAGLRHGRIHAAVHLPFCRWILEHGACEAAGQPAV